MMRKNRSLKNAAESAVRMAIRAVEDSGRSVELQVRGVDPAPGALDLPETEQTCSRCGRPAVGWCPECGCPLCGDCVAGD
jgi:rubrerythrin